MPLAVFSTKEFERGETGWASKLDARGTHDLALCPPYQHGHPFSSGSFHFDLSTEFVDFFGDRLDLIDASSRK